jgi:hypothetical protein
MSVREHSIAIIQQAVTLLALLDYLETERTAPTLLARAREWVAWLSPWRWLEHKSE